MNNFWHKNLVLGMIALYVLVAVACLIVSDRSVRSLLNSVRAVNLAHEAESSQATIELEVATLNQQVDHLKAAVLALQKRTYPSLQEFKALQTKHHLNIFQMERVTNPKKSTPDLLRYNAVVTGTVGSVVRFLDELESIYISRSEQVALHPANEDGSMVALATTLLLREQ